MLQSQIICHTFICLSQPRPLRNCLMETRDIPKELGLIYVFSQWFHYISSGTSLIFSRLPLQHHLIRRPKILCCFSKGYIWTYRIFWLCLPSSSFIGITPPASKQCQLTSNRNSQSQHSKKQKCYFPNCLWYIKKKNLSQIIHTYDKKRTHGGISKKYPWIETTLP